MAPLNLLLLFGIFAGVFAIIRHTKKRRWITPEQPFPDSWRQILMQLVAFYASLDANQKKRFEQKVLEFMANYTITGIDTYIDITDKLLVASGAVIPIFAFPQWRYNNLNEVLIYPAAFNENFQTSGGDTNILGMVGTGFMEGKMIISKPALRNGFLNDSDRKNTAIHEFLHLIDKSDGTTDGIPQMLLDKPFLIPWLDLVKKEIDAIYTNKSEINPYGGTSYTEFFAVAGEYFFEKPQMMSTRHPELYNVLETAFQQQLKSKKKYVPKAIHRNNPCPCNSGKKYKQCCGR